MQWQDSVSVCSACPECASVDGSSRVVAFHDLTVVPEEAEFEGNKVMLLHFLPTHSEIFTFHLRFSVPGKTSRRT